jgi:hypothetical protein
MKRRVSILFVLVVLVLWQVHADPQQAKGNLTAPWFYSRSAPAAPQEMCCENPNETDPHSECVDGACTTVSGCGVSDCSGCEGCDPAEEWSCINDGGNWDPNTCTCDFSCDPTGSMESECIYSGGTWDPFSCSCTPWQCNPGPPELDNTVCSSNTGCDYDWCYEVTCESCTYTYVQYCEDGSLYDTWTEDTGTQCYYTGYYCSNCS